MAAICLVKDIILTDRSTKGDGMCGGLRGRRSPPEGRGDEVDQGVRTFPCVHLPPVGSKGAGGIPRCWRHPMVMGSFPRAARIHSKGHRIKQFRPQGAWPEQRRRRKSYPQAQSSLRVIVRYLARNMMMSLFGKTDGAGYLLQTRLFFLCSSQDISIHAL